MDVVKFLRTWQNNDSSALIATYCVVAPSEKSRDALAHQLQANGFRPVTITANNNHTDERGVVYMSTMHRAKGLEFDCVAVVVPKNYIAGPAEEGNFRQLLYVALTRAKKGAALLLY